MAALPNKSDIARPVKSRLREAERTARLVHGSFQPRAYDRPGERSRLLRLWNRQGFVFVGLAECLPIAPCGVGVLLGVCKNRLPPTALVGERNQFIDIIADPSRPPLRS